MKKIVTCIILAILLISAMILLVGCEIKPIIATKHDSDDTVGEYDTRLEITYEKDTIASIQVSMTFADESVAKLIKDNKNNNQLQKSFEVEGNTATCVFTAEEYKEAYGADYSTKSREEVVETLEDMGFTIEE